MKYLLTLAIAATLFSCKQKAEETAAPAAAPVSDTTAVPTLTQRWATDTILKTPESVVFDEKYGVFYVSCIGAVPPDAKDKDGYIAKLNQRGEIIKKDWITGLSGPKGMAVKGDSLYVTDIDALVLIHTPSGKIMQRIPVKGAKFLNDVAVDDMGLVYFSDSYANNLHTWDGKKVATLATGESLGGPNGIFNEKDRLVVASFGKGNVYTFNKSDAAIAVMVDTLPGGDGVEAFRDGYLVSNWNGEVYYINKDWKKQLLLDTKADKKNAADIEFVPAQNLLLVPEFFANKVTAYDVK